MSNRLTPAELAQMHKQTEPQPQERKAEQPELEFKTVNRPKRPASIPSVSYLRDLLLERMPDFDLEDPDNRAYFESVVEQGQARVSQAIQKLLATPVIPHQQRKRQQNLFPNKFPGNCRHCTIQVPAGEGTIEKLPNGKWAVAHKDGDCPQSEFPFPLGRYAVPTEEGHLGFYFASERGLFLQHGSDLSLLPNKAAASIIEKIAKDPREASIRYGLELGNCGVCGRALTNEESRERGIGPVCADKEGWS